MDFTKATLLVTGGGSGIGRALAQRLDDRGATVIVAGRRADALQQTIRGRDRMAALVLDANAPGSIAGAVAQVAREHPRLNALVNCAGVMHWEDLRTQRDLRDAEQTVTTNLLGPIRITNALLPQLQKQSEAAIVNVTSGLAFVPLPGAATYSATKAALHSYTVSLRAQLAGRIEVVELAPPAVQTELTPGQSTRAGYMPLDAFADEAVAILLRQPTPAEVLVERVRFLRTAEAEGTYDRVLGELAKLHP